VPPFSGHVRVLTCSALAGPSFPRYRALARALLAETTVFKLFMWRGTHSW
jgi:hypothetical protein